jgi:hypothetical protein
MSTPHKHAEIIKAWADGYQVEAYNPERDTWITVKEPGWFADIEYRIRPGVMVRPPVPKMASYDVRVELDPFDEDLVDFWNHCDTYNLRLVFKDERLVKAFVIDDCDEDAPW